MAGEAEGNELKDKPSNPRRQQQTEIPLVLLDVAEEVTSAFLCAVWLYNVARQDPPGWRLVPKPPGICVRTWRQHWREGLDLLNAKLPFPISIGGGQGAPLEVNAGSYTRRDEANEPLPYASLPCSPEQVLRAVNSVPKCSAAAVLFIAFGIVAFRLENQRYPHPADLFVLSTRGYHRLRAMIRLGLVDKGKGGGLFLPPRGWRAPTRGKLRLIQGDGDALDSTPPAARQAGESAPTRVVRAHRA